MKLAEADIFGFSEINLDTTNHEVHDALQTEMTTAFDHHHAALASTPTPSDKHCKPGGCQLSCADDIAGRKISSGKDELGRWSCVKFARKGDGIVTFAQACQVCARTSTATGTTASHQQESLLRQMGRPDVNPRRNFKNDLHQFIKGLATNGESATLAGDFNEELLPGKSATSKLCEDPETQMIDAMALRQVDKEISTCIRGSKQIDFALVMPDIIDTVKSCGYEPFHYRLMSDHGGCYVDFDTQKLFGNETTRLARPTQREFSAKCPRSVCKHAKALNNHLEANNFCNKLAEIKTNPDHLQAEKLDKIMCESMHHAAKTCRRCRRDWWSTPFAKALNKRHLSQKAVSAHMNGHAMQNSLERQANEQDLDWQHPTNSHEAKSLLRKTAKELQKARSKSRELGAEHMEKLAEEHATEGNADQEKIVKAMKNKETDRQMWSKFKKARGKGTSSGFTSIKMPQDWPDTEEGFKTQGASNPKQCSDDAWKTADLPHEVNFYLRMGNQLHFGKAQGTPFTKPPLSTKADWAANSVTSDLILNGECTDNELDDITQLLINNCKRRQQAILEKTVTRKQWIKRMKKWWETTSTSPSGLHLGHCKAMTNRLSVPEEDLDPDLSIKEQHEAAKRVRDAVLNAKIDMTNHATQHRCTCNRWKTIVTSMIEKDPGDHRIHRLRVIHLHEADLAMLLGIHWRQLLKKATKNNDTNLGQHGGMPGEEAKSLALLEELKHDTSCATRKTLFNGDNDADSCCDRIIPALASLLGRKHGLHRNATFVHATTLKEALHELKTTKGVSEECCSHCQAFPIHGSGQGSTNSPVIWILISSCLFDAHRSQAHGAFFCAPDEQMSIALSMVGFADDSTINVNDFLADPQPTPSEMLANCKQDAQLWNDLLWASGGMLELKKCSYHLVHFDFDADGTPVMRTHFPDLDDLALVDAKTGKSAVLQRKTIFEAHKTLGHHRAPAGKSQTQLQALKKNSQKLVEQAPQCPMTPNEALRCCNCACIKSMECVLPQSFFDPVQLDNVDRKAQQMFTRRSGLSGSMSLAIRHGPEELAGAAMTQLSTIQGEGQMLNFLKHWRSCSNAGKVLRIALAWCQMQAGVSFSMLSNTAIPLPHLEERWIPALRKFLNKMQATIELDNDCAPPRQRDNDLHVMDAIINSEDFSDDEIKMANHCRLHLQAVTLSDLTLVDGTSLDMNKHFGTPDEDSSKTNHVQINQQRPNLKAWRAWWRTMMLFANSDLELDVPLGAWSHSADKLRQSWPACGTIDGEFAHAKHSEGCMKTQRNHDNSLTEIEVADEMPLSTCLPISIANETWDFEPNPPIEPAENPAPESFTKHLEGLPSANQELFADIQLLATIPEIASHAHLTSVHDGSSSDKTMSFGWVLAAPDGTRLANCSGPAFGRSSSSCHSESHGMLSAAKFALHLSTHAANADDIEFQFASDNKSMLDRIDEMMEHEAPHPNATLTSDWDVLNEIKLTLQQLAKLPTAAWVKGHQDDNKDYEDLDLEAQLNVDADWLASACARIWPACRPNVPRLTQNTAQLHMQGKTITSHCSKEIRHAAHYQTLHKHIIRKNNWDQETATRADWSVLKAALKRNKHRRTFLIKLCHNILPLGEITKHCDKQAPTTCTFCGHTDNNLNHLLSCGHKTVATWRKTFKNDIEKHAAHLTTRPGLTKVMLQGTDTVSTPSAQPFESDQHKAAIDAQHKIGWMQLLQGKWSSAWASLQNECYEFSGTKSNQNTGHLWAVKILSRIWDQTHNPWTPRNEHEHGKDNSTQEKARKQRAITAIEELQKKKDEMLASDHVCLIDDVSTWAKPKKSTHLINWINTWTPLIHASVRAATDFGLQHTAMITDYFHSNRPRLEKRPPRPRLSRKHGRHKNPNRVARKRRRPPSFTKHAIPRLFAGHSRPMLPTPT